MNLFKRTWMSVTKRKGKTLILFLVVFLIGNIMAGAVAINNSTTQLENSMKNQLGAKASIDINFNMEGGITPETMVNLTSEQVEKVGELPQVKNLSYDLSLMLGSETLKNYAKEEKEDQNTSMGGGGMMVSSFGGAEGLTMRGFKGTPPEELTKKEIEITEGEYPKEGSESNEILISEEYAKTNNLKLGDTLKHSTYKIDYQAKGNDVSYEYKTEYDFKIVGLFKVNSKPNNTQDPMASFMDDMQHNTGYVAFDKANEIDKQSAKDMMGDDNSFCKTEEACRSMIIPIYELNSVDEIDDFVEEAEKIIDTDKFVISTTKDDYDKVAGSIVNMKDMSEVVLVFGIGAAILILTLVLFLFIRDRKHEFGVYQALGESKFKSTLQVLLEVLVITVIGVSFAFVSGNVLAKNISNNMIQNQMNANKENEMNDMSGFVMMGGPNTNLSGITEEKIIENYKVEVTPESIVMFYSIMIGSALIATGAASVYILRLKPREILL